MDSFDVWDSGYASRLDQATQTYFSLHIARHHHARDAHQDCHPHRARNLQQDRLEIGLELADSHTPKRPISDLLHRHTIERLSLMRWKSKDERFLFILVPAPEASWVFLCGRNKVMCH